MVRLGRIAHHARGLWNISVRDPEQFDQGRVALRSGVERWPHRRRRRTRRARADRARGHRPAGGSPAASSGYRSRRPFLSPVPVAPHCTGRAPNRRVLGSAPAFNSTWPRVPGRCRPGLLSTSPAASLLPRARLPAGSLLQLLRCHSSLSTSTAACSRNSGAAHASTSKSFLM